METISSVSSVSKVPTGIIEGFYGQPWSWEERWRYARFLQKCGCKFYYYAPKADPWLRRKWREPFPRDLEENLEVTVDAFQSREVEFGVGFSPFEIHLSDFDSTAKARLLDRLSVFNRLKIDRLAILFDDMKGDLPGLARVQADIMHWIRERSSAHHLVMCPTYYSLDPVLDRVFGKKPPSYLEELGRLLDPSIGLFWTGELVCSVSYTAEHLSQTGNSMKRKPFLWDNYPVNDGPRMCKFLHLKPFVGRPAVIGDTLEGHAINPMNQPTLSRIVILTLLESYSSGSDYDPEKAFLRAANAVAGPELAKLLERDLETFQCRGLDQLTEVEKVTIRARYAPYVVSSRGAADEDETRQVAQEVIDWLDGKSVVTREIFESQ